MEWPFKCALCFSNCFFFVCGDAGDQRIDVQRNVDSKFMPEATKAGVIKLALSDPQGVSEAFQEVYD